MSMSALSTRLWLWLCHEDREQRTEERGERKGHDSREDIKILFDNDKPEH